MGSLSGTNGKSKPPKKASKNDFRFINHSLSKSDEEWLEAADLDAEYDFTLVCDLVAEGYKFSLSHDERNQTYVASLTDRAEGSAFYNSCLTGRGASAIDALHALLYRHVHLAQGDWAFFDQPAGRNPSRYS